MKKINGIEWKNALISGANNIENKKMKTSVNLN